MSNYYADKLNSQSLFQVYATAIPRIEEYLNAEINFVKNRLLKSGNVLELGAGYGRIIKELAPYCDKILGIDISEDNIELSKEYLKPCLNADIIKMNAHQMSFSQSFDVAICLQNGLSAMKATPQVIQNILDVLSPGGTAYFSTYSTNFWDWRIKWFEEQASKGLLGELDYEQTKNGVIACKDGFCSTTQTIEDYKAIGDSCGYPYQIQEVDNSSLFLIIKKS